MLGSAAATPCVIQECLKRISDNLYALLSGQSSWEINSAETHWIEPNDAWQLRRDNVHIFEYDIYIIKVDTKVFSTCFAPFFFCVGRSLQKNVLMETEPLTVDERSSAKHDLIWDPVKIN